MSEHGHYAECYYSVGTDVVEELAHIAPRSSPNSPTRLLRRPARIPQGHRRSRWLHNYTVFAVQKRFYRAGFPFVLLPIRV